MGTAYGQFCPVAKAMELLDERWTMLLVRELVMGSEHFNDLRRGLPRMSPSLLSKRLQQLVRAGIVEKRVDGTDVRYLLTPAGEELRPVVEAVGAWGARWIGEIGDRDLDPKLLLWDMRRNIVEEATPPGRTVVELRFPELRASQRRWWLVIGPDEVDVCDDDPGHEVDLVVTTSLRTLTQVWMGLGTWDQARGAGQITVDGPAALRRALPGWLALSTFAHVERGPHVVRV
ncbi:MAG: helix-turn-helix transcriptional regulator [Marmoricola sp.]|nr:helix-turn-helix transcriptional regulator [Marmoricola sp.]